MNPKITVLLCTVRPDNGYIEHPEWGTRSKICDDLEVQTFKDFELIIVDGVPRENGKDLWCLKNGALVWRIPPRDTLWTRNHKVAICAYRNTGLIHARGELVVNLDDCCELPPRYLEAFWHAWNKYKTCLAMTWPESGDWRTPGRVHAPPGAGVSGRPGDWRPPIYGFGSYPLATALDLNGYDEAYDGGQGLEDADWSLRLYRAGVKFVLFHIPGFRIHAQSGHDPRAIDSDKPLEKCCNPAFWVQQQLRNTQVANTAACWGYDSLDAPYGFREKLVGPCELLNDNDTCKFHNGLNPCAYLSLGFPRERTAMAEAFLREPPIFDLKELRKEQNDG